MHQFLIAAATSNSGKTTLTMGLLRALSRRGLTVQPFKCGPDYIDPMYHHIASGRQSISLDGFMSSSSHIRDLFSRYSQDSDMQIVEGVMGMYDGYDGWHGSSAELATTLDIPVLLVVNARSVAYSVAPLIYGFCHFCPPQSASRPRIQGVIFNQVASEGHYASLLSACTDAGVPCLGYLSRNASLAIPGRHLGLTVSERDRMESFINLAADEVEAHVDLERLLR